MAFLWIVRGWEIEKLRRDCLHLEDLPPTPLPTRQNDRGFQETPQTRMAYFIWSTPRGYEAVNRREEVRIEAPMGKRNAEHTFLIRRMKSDD